MQLINLMYPVQVQCSGIQCQCCYSALIGKTRLIS